MIKHSLPDQNELHMLLDYNPMTGVLLWKERPTTAFKTAAAGLTWNKRFAGKQAFTAMRPDGYYGGAINYTNYLAHRVIFKYLHGYDPDQVDHDDRDRSNNKAENLIDASATSNSRNSKLYSNNTSGTVGVYWSSKEQRWIASITINYIHKRLGAFKDINDAIQTRSAAEKLHNFHPNHGT